MAGRILDKDSVKCQIGDLTVSKRKAPDHQEWVSNHKRKSNPNLTQTQTQTLTMTVTITNSRLLIMVPPIEYGLGYQSRNKVQP